MNPDDIDRAVTGRTIVYALIEGDSDALRSAITGLDGSREAQLSTALALVWAEMLPDYLAAHPEARLLKDSRQLVEEVTEWLTGE